MNRAVWIIPRGMSDEPNKLFIKTPAKVNLYLEVLGRRKNGYHDIRSVIMPVSLYDILVLEKTDEAIETIVRCGGIPNEEEMRLISQEDNLATRAALLLKQETGYPGGARIQLEKNIPVGGGLGGGSSDAVAVLIGLNRLWKAGFTKEELAKIGSRLGCDVPSMLYGGTVLIEGLGEKITPIPVREESTSWRMVIVNPCFGVSTGDIYSRYSSSLTSEVIPVSTIISALKDGKIDLAAKGLFNNLEETVFRKYPLIEIIAETIEEAGAIGVLLSGSGASVFGLARDDEHAHNIDNFVREKLGSFLWTRVVRSLPDGVMVAHGPLEA